MITEIAATLAFSAMQNNDKVGVIFFSDKMEKFIPPQKGRKHILYIIRELIEFKPENNQTDLSVALQYLTNVIKKRCTAFLISDFLVQQDFQTDLTLANRKHDVVAIQVYDQRETELPSVGLIRVKDAETGREMLIDSASKNLRNNYRRWWEKQELRLDTTFKKSKVDAVSVSTAQDYVKALMALFNLRN